jgi:FkbM family methyltransferase
MIFTPSTANIVADDKNKTNETIDEIFTQDCYFPAFANKVIIDVGACIGLFSIYAYKFAKQIYAIEPHPVNYANLVENVKNNNLDKIKTFNLAIAGKNGDGFVRDMPSLEGTKFGFDKGSHKVKALTLASFFKENDIKYADIVKIDTEGSEHEIFKAEDINDVESKIGIIIMEAHGNFGFPLRGWKWQRHGDRIFTFYKS